MKKLLWIFLIITFFSFSADNHFDFLPKGKTNETIVHQYYTLSYSPEHKQAEWVAYQVLKVNIEKPKVKRRNNFRPDPKVADSSATLEDYRGSGYDRGHLAPAADMSYDMTAMSESFYLSNMSPQIPEFNRGIWKNLEAKVRSWVYDCNSLYIVTGPSLTHFIDTIGPGNIPVPKYFYKVILDYEKPGIKSIAFVLPNEKGDRLLSEYVVTIDSVESLTGIDFFPALPDKLEDKLESKKQIGKWPLF